MNLIGTEGKRCTFHDLRHTFATAAIAAGVDVKTVSSILGHANAAMTLNVYASADPDAKRRAAAVIDKAI
jgi:integrase